MKNWISYLAVGLAILNTMFLVLIIMSIRSIKFDLGDHSECDFQLQQEILAENCLLDCGEVITEQNKSYIEDLDLCEKRRGQDKEGYDRVLGLHNKALDSYEDTVKKMPRSINSTPESVNKM